MNCETSHHSPQTQTKQKVKEEKRHERKQALCGCDCYTSHICRYVSSLKSCIRPWNEQLHLHLLQTSSSNPFPHPFCFLLRMETSTSFAFWDLLQDFLPFSLITLSLDIYGIGLVYTSATLAAAVTNCLPVITFFLALLLRIESLNIKTKAGIAKLVGIVACLAGASILAFFKGPHFKLLSHHHLLRYHPSQQHQTHASSSKWIKGCFLLLLSNTFWGLWLVLQAFVIKSYPSKLMFTTLQCFLSSIQSFVIAFAIERNIEEWKLDWNVRLLAVVYCGIMVTGVTYYLQTWVVEKKGPMFLAMSTPLALIITIFSSIVLGEIISLGSLLGGFVLVLGLYSVLWGKSKEQMPKDSLDLEQTSEQA